LWRRRRKIISAAAEARATIVIGTDVDTAIVVFLEEVSASADSLEGSEVVLASLVVVGLELLGLLVVVVGLSGEEGDEDVVVGI
jgi:hypothetical protein